ncbi:L,D-transpeptidase family protein [Thiocystis violacea]|uniref:L,D-transpeptidase family protein n=1 Tax=Thiocystis violacea TaxID=13725 RepID=UPI001908B3CF|nr:L,D-transpeptidase family protein [Thiocystis violacea]MBK1720187.1 murein L,D-transpeptidase [Thiocystis violacea]
MPHRVHLNVLSLLLALMPLCGQANPLLAETLESWREAKTLAIDGVPLLSGRLLANFYVQRGNEPVWSSDPEPLKTLLELVEESEADGFLARDFHVDRLRAMSEPGAFENLSESQRIGIDIQLTDALLRYVHHTRFGKLDPVAIDRKWNDRVPIPEELLIADMNGALKARDPGVFLASRFPAPFWYEDLKRGLGRYSGSRHLHGLPPLPAGANLGPGSQGARVALLRERLRLLGHPGATPPEDPELFDTSLAEAVRGFQRRHGLAADGVVGPGTLVAINGPFDENKVRQIRVNLERMRWLYNDLPSDYVFVDVADYMTHLVRNEEITWSTRAIVGSEEAQTPMFRDSLDHLVFNPTWTVPISIQKKMGSVSARYTLVDRRTGRKASGGNAGDYKRYRVVQQPGPGNALGRVKFMFPNRHAVYLHDTPGKGLFERSSRALSHGCVRVQNPMKLAELLLNESAWDRAKIDRIIDGNRTRHVNLTEQLPVLLYYLTARADREGVVRFRPDVYKRDQGVREALDQPLLTTRIAFSEPTPLTPEPSHNADPGEPASPEDGEPGEERPLQSGMRLTQSDDEDR